MSDSYDDIKQEVANLQARIMERFPATAIVTLWRTCENGDNGGGSQRAGDDMLCTALAERYALNQKSQWNAPQTVRIEDE